MLVRSAAFKKLSACSDAGSNSGVCRKITSFYFREDGSFFFQPALRDPQAIEKTPWWGLGIVFIISSLL